MKKNKKTTKTAQKPVERPKLTDARDKTRGAKGGGKTEGAREAQSEAGVRCSDLLGDGSFLQNILSDSSFSENIFNSFSVGGSLFLGNAQGNHLKHGNLPQAKGFESVFRELESRLGVKCSSSGAVGQDDNFREIHGQILVIKNIEKRWSDKMIMKYPFVFNEDDKGKLSLVKARTRFRK